MMAWRSHTKGADIEFQWINESTVTERDGMISIFAPEHTDFFCNSGAEAE